MKKNTKEQLVTEIAELRQQLTTQKQVKADYDLLTGLPTRTLLYDRLMLSLLQANREGRIMAVLFLCVENLKIINDIYGQHAGDLLLKAISELLGKCLRKGDTIARPGRNEFIIMLPEIKRRDDAIMIAEKTLTALNEPFLIGNHELFINTNIGISLYPDDGRDAEVLIKNSYTAMLHAKEEGRNNFKFFSGAMNDRALEQMIIENSLRMAIKRKEFVLYYHPQIDLMTGRIIGTEALLRWYRPESGLVFPLDFIPAAEENGLIIPIGEWALYTACAQQKEWQAAGFAPERVAVNLSARQFYGRNFIEMVSRVLNETGLDPASLELELTESINFQDDGQTVKTLNKLKDIGILISIDDFGTGYSSLNYLKQFPAYKVKLVRSFVSSIPENPVDSAIAKLIIDLSHVLKMKVIAEGVETTEQLELLRSIDCDEAQGYFFCKPLHTSDLTNLLTKKEDSYHDMIYKPASWHEPGILNRRFEEVL